MRHDFSSPLEMVQTIHANHDGRQGALAWPDIIPAVHRDKLRRRTGLYDRLAQYAAAAGKLSVSERQQVLACLVQQNRIADLVICSTDCESLSDLPKAIHAPIAELFGFAFELLTGLGVRDRHYQAIYTAAPYHVCPFCGCEYFDCPCVRFKPPPSGGQISSPLCRPATIALHILQQWRSYGLSIWQSYG
jgi:hypothetical protein